LNPLTPSNSDLSVQLLNKLLGAGWQNFAGNSGGFFQQILSLYDTTLFAVLGIIAVYSLTMGIAEASHDGVPLGKRYSKWMPVRIVAASAFLAPVPPAGISIVQSVILWLVGMSVGFADNVWTAGAQYLIKGGPAVIVNSNTGTELAKDALQSLVCQDYVNSEYYYIGQGTQYNGTDPMNPNSPPQILAPMPGQYVQEQQQNSTFTITNPQTSGYGPSFFGSQPGGTSTQNIIDQIGFNGAANSGLGPGVCGSFTFQYSNNTPAASSVASAQSSALTQMLATLAPLAVQIVNPPGTGVATTSASSTPQLPNPQPLYTAINNYQNAISSAAASAASQGSNASVLQTWLSTATSGGWLTAGSFFISFAKQNERLSRLVSKKWDYQGAAVDSLAEPSNGTYGLKNYMQSTESYTKILDSSSNFVGNPPTPGQLADASGSVSTGSSVWSKVLSLLSSPMTGIITSFSNMTAQNGDPILTAQSLGMTVIDGAEAALVAVATFKVGSTSANTATKNASKIPIVGGAFGAVAGAVTSAAKALGNVTWDMALIITIPLLILGAGLAYLLPALPFILFTRGVLAWVFGIFESLFASPIWGIFHAQPDGEGFLHESVRTGYLRILELFIRPVLMIIGFFIFFQMYEALSFLILTGFGAMVSGVTAGSMSGIVAIISFLCVLDFLMISSIWTLGKLCIIDLPSLVLTWAGGHGASQGTPETMGTPGRHQGVDALIGGAATRELLRGKNQTQVKPEITGKEKP
jgi:conjugal transfer/type IV secretion protein DotA/TraY